MSFAKNKFLAFALRIFLFAVLCPFFSAIAGDTLEQVFMKPPEFVKALAAKHDLHFTIEPYDLNPVGDLALGDVADTPACEFWSKAWGGVNTDYSVFDAVSSAHTGGSLKFICQTRRRLFPITGKLRDDDVQ